MRRAIGEFVITEASGACAKHHHTRAVILAIARGTAVEDGTRVLRSGTIAYRPAGFEHALQSDDCTILRIDIDKRALRTSIELQPCDATSMIAKLRRELRARDGASGAAMKAAILAKLAAIARERGVSPRMQSAMDVIRARYREPIALGDVAASIGIAPDALAKRFRRAFGRTVGDAIRAVRIEDAIARLGESAGWRDVARACGFCDPPHFVRSFEPAQGITPAEFRRVHERIR